MFSLEYPENATQQVKWCRFKLMTKCILYIQLKQVHSGVIYLGLPVNRQKFTFLRMESFADCNKLPSIHSIVQDI